MEQEINDVTTKTQETNPVEIEPVCLFTMTTTRIKILSIYIASIIFYSFFNENYIESHLLVLNFIFIQIVAIGITFLADSIKKRWWTHRHNQIKVEKWIDFVFCQFKLIVMVVLLSCILYLTILKLLGLYGNSLFLFLHDYIPDSLVTNLVLAPIAFIISYFSNIIILKKILSRYRNFI